jgi:hypothetical protein
MLYKFTIKYHSGIIRSGLANADSYDEVAFSLEHQTKEKIDSMYIQYAAGEEEIPEIKTVYCEEWGMSEYYYNMSEKEKMAYKTILRMYSYGNQTKDEIRDYVNSMYKISNSRFEEMYNKVKDNLII